MHVVLAVYTKDWFSPSLVPLFTRELSLRLILNTTPISKYLYFFMKFFIMRVVDVLYWQTNMDLAVEHVIYDACVLDM